MLDPLVDFLEVTGQRIDPPCRVIKVADIDVNGRLSASLRFCWHHNFEGQTGPVLTVFPVDRNDLQFTGQIMGPFELNVGPRPLNIARLIKSQATIDQLGPVGLEALAGGLFRLEVRLTPIRLGLVKKILPRFTQIRNRQLQTPRRQLVLPVGLISD